MSETDSPSRPLRVRELWSGINFPLFLACRSTMVGARQMLSVAVGWDIYAATGDVVALGLIGLAMFFPVLFFAIPAGVVVDRFDRRLVLCGALALHVLATIGIGYWFWTGAPGIAPIYLFLFLGGTAHAFFNPALHSTLPRLVPRELFSNAVATASSVSKVSQLAGPVLGGLLVAAGGQIVYGVVTGLFALAAIAAASIRADLRIKAKEPVSLAVLMGGVRFILSTPTVLAAVSMDMIAVLFGGILGILPVFATDILGVGPEGLGLMRAAPAIGAFCVGLALAAWRLPWAVGRSFFVSLTVFSLAILVFAFSRSFALSLAALALYGAADMVSVYVRQTLVQIDTPDDLRGRVSSVNMFSAGGSTQLGDFRAGVMAGLVGTPVAVAIGGAITLGATALWYRKFPTLRNMINF